MTLQMDFVSDWAAIMKSKLGSMGYTVPASLDHDGIAQMYLNALKRRVVQGPRTIHTSKEFTCPTRLHPGLENLRSKVRRGDELKPHLSRFLKNLSFDDAMLNDWGVYHFHLGITIESDGYVEREDPVLFALVTSDMLYEISTFPHKQWSNLDVVEIIHGNWPHLISSFRIPVAGPPSQVPISANIATLRKGKVNANISLNDRTVYAPIGAGYTLAGTSTEVVILKNGLKRDVQKLQKRVQKELPQITADLTSEGCPAGAAVTVKLEQDGDRWVGRFPGFQYTLNFGQLKLT